MRVIEKPAYICESTYTCFPPESTSTLDLHKRLQRLYSLHGNNTPNYIFTPSPASPFKLELSSVIFALSQHFTPENSASFRLLCDFFDKINSPQDYLFQTPEFYEHLKQLIERIFFHIEKLPPSKNKMMQNHLSEIAEALNVCAAGMLTRLERVLYDLTTATSIEDWITDIRETIVAQVADLHIEHHHITEGNSIHVHSKLKKLAHLNGFLLKNGEQFIQLRDPFERTALLTSDLELNYIHEMFSRLDHNTLITEVATRYLDLFFEFQHCDFSLPDKLQSFIGLCAPFTDSHIFELNDVLKLNTQNGSYELTSSFDVHIKKYVHELLFHKGYLTLPKEACHLSSETMQTLAPEYFLINTLCDHNDPNSIYQQYTRLSKKRSKLASVYQIENELRPLCDIYLAAASNLSLTDFRIMLIQATKYIFEHKINLFKKPLYSTMPFLRSNLLRILQNTSTQLSQKNNLLSSYNPEKGESAYLKLLSLKPLAAIHQETEISTQQKITAATHIQTAARRCLAKKNYHQQREIIVKTQAYARRFLAQKNFQQQCEVAQRQRKTAKLYAFTSRIHASLLLLLSDAMENMCQRNQTNNNKFRNLEIIDEHLRNQSALLSVSVLLSYSLLIQHVVAHKRSLFQSKTYHAIQPYLQNIITEIKQNRRTMLTMESNECSFFRSNIESYAELEEKISFPLHLTNEHYSP